MTWQLVALVVLVLAVGWGVGVRRRRFECFR